MPTNRQCSSGKSKYNHQYTSWKMDKTYPLFKLRLRCPECGVTIGPDLDGIAKKGCNYTNDIRSVALDISTVEHIIL